MRLAGGLALALSPLRAEPSHAASGWAWWRRRSRDSRSQRTPGGIAAGTAHQSGAAPQALPAVDAARSSLIHRDPARPWSVASLADEVAMSYVTRWRMHVAVAALREEGANVAELANRLGYRSEAAFARAFKRVVGLPPGAIKRQPQGRTLAPAA